MARFTPLLSLLLVTLAAAQSRTTAPAEIQNLNILRDGADLKIEITLTQSVQPAVIVAESPARLVMDFPNTSSSAKQRRRDVDQGGVKTIRYGLNSTMPLVTRMVIDLEEYRSHTLITSGNKVTISIPLPAKPLDHSARKGAPAPAASGSLLGRLHRNPQPTFTHGETDITLAPVTPPPALSPLKLPETQATSNVPGKAAARATAAHPNYGSLQQGTVFPNTGSAGAGTVPAVSTASVVAGQTNPDLATPSINSNAKSNTPTNSFPAANTVLVGTTNGKVTPFSSVAAGPPSIPSTTTQTLSPAPTAVGSLVSRGTPAAPDLALDKRSASLAEIVPKTSIAKAQPASVAGQASPAASTIKNSAAPSPPTVPVTTLSADSLSAKTLAVTAPIMAATTAAATSASSPGPEALVSDHGTSVVDNTTVANTSPSPDPSLPVLAARQPNSDVRMSFKIKYVTEGAAYLDGGKSAGLSEGMKLEVRDVTVTAGQAPDPSHPSQQVIADLEVISVAETSAVTEIRTPQRDVKPGDYAFLSSLDTESLIAQRSLSATRKYPTVISFTEGDPLDEEAREEVPRPPLPEINRARGRFGFDYSSVVSHGAFSSTSSSTGIVIRTDITRIGGTYWNLNGYWRGRLTHSSSSGQQTLQDLLNRTYTLGLTYDNPRSPWVAGFGRLYLPYATSLDSIDGGYFGRRVTSSATVGIFAGSTPDPASWSYNPNQEISGIFVNFQGGSFDATRYTNTVGVGVNMLKWSINRPFIFFENGIYYKRFFSVYSAVQADRPAGNAAVASPGAGLSRSFTTVRLQPLERFEFDVNHTYFRDIPTFDATLIGTGLLDKYLFQGFSFGPRVQVVKDIWVYSSFGRSSRSGDAKASWNQMYGVTLGHVPWTRVRADVHYSKFDSSFGAGKYTAMSLSRSLKDTFRWELLAGIQDYSSALAANNRSHFVTGTFEAPLGANFFLQSGYTWNRGGTQNYDQYLFSIGYRFDSKYKSNHQ